MKLYVINTNTPFNIDARLEGGELSLTITPAPDTQGGEVPEPHVRKLRLESLRERPDFGDHALYELYDSNCSGGKKANNVLFNSVSNIYAMTLQSKIDAGTYHNLVTQIYPLLGVYVPLATSPVEEWALALRVHPDAEVTVSENITKESGITMPTTGEVVVFPVVRFDHSEGVVAADGTIDIPFHLETAQGEPLTHRQAEVYLEATAGILVKRRVKTENGVGIARFHAASLRAGDAAKVKCGFKYFTGTDDFAVTVV